jgi:carboxyl-terminal processing protease
LEWDRVPPARHAELDRVAPWLSALRDASARRTATNQNFAWLREDNDRIKARLADPVVSLNEKQRRQEKAESDARAKARSKDRSGRQPLRETQYEIMLRNADQPGLPKPLSPAVNSPRVDDSDNDTQSSDSALAGKDVASDSILEETQHILLDYISLLNDPATLTRHLLGRETGEVSMR